MQRIVENCIGTYSIDGHLYVAKGTKIVWILIGAVEIPKHKLK